MNKIVDAKGKNCPIPVIMAKKEIDNGNVNFVVEVDNKIANENLKKLGNSMSFEIKSQEVNGIFKVHFLKGEADNNESEICEECNEIIEEIKRDKLSKWSIFIGKEIIGSGSEELGKSLMKMYFYTMTESDDLPKSILFMNEGVKIPALNEQIVEHLKDLEKKGVEILVCGTCLNFYGLEEELKVGKVSNMYEISNYMKSSSKVITL
ncbi:sulfurtransferase-like selenium metabolism protein YedF [Clostridium botulinum]|uniref:sulfurtransferase-like selenium metabolism protein YedF n=1 Tax=Clostridium botulinum TaxID=1491 RepID=UPI0013F0D784|nr:sulfurtransferase-like selenium metabolism protein YedF [Clostridium botulinum]NFG22523.1 sulfurtransferase-like selenium metabolism protein YedF [Clostridium botulinum]NFH88972.1 sulfurtransferase-like selenium metabolism protein YedF [Clostridium botulinum]NFI16558.1 sulfurtransferase-like selenium metabolism protein YedF [Clostridium botulinum]NFI52738.1 sulfurtransferase-like selenium metabolism protein YedF [Clostridium botulinum]NFL91905.1 sulfurtransferase-like selenium metabolism pr